MNSSRPAPRFSIVMSAWRSHGTMRRSLDSLARQTLRDFEVIIVDSSPGDEAVAIARDYPDVRLIRPGRRMSPHEARNTGAREARAGTLVFTDPDCVADPGWLARIADSFHDGHLFVGGPIATWPGGLLEEATFLAKFWKWLPNGGSRYYDDIPSASMAVHRILYEAAGGVPESHISGDTAFCHRITAAAGLKPWFNDAAVTQHINEVTWRGAFRERFQRGKAFGAMRISEPGWGGWRSFLITFGWPVLAARHVAMKLEICRRRQHLGLFLKVWPVVAALDAAWMMGQAASGWESLCATRMQRDDADPEADDRRPEREEEQRAGTDRLRVGIGP